MLRVKNKQTIFARNLVCLRKRPPAEKNVAQFISIKSDKNLAFEHDHLSHCTDTGPHPQNTPSYRHPVVSNMVDGEK